VVCAKAHSPLLIVVLKNFVFLRCTFVKISHSKDNGDKKYKNFEKINPPKNI